MSLETLIAFITVVPALAWFVTAFTKLYKLYQKNEVKIKTVAKEKTEQIKEGAEAAIDKVEELAKKAQAPQANPQTPKPNPENNAPKPPLQGGVQ